MSAFSPGIRTGRGALLVRGADAEGHLDDDRLIALMLGAGPTGRNPVKIGIDAPLGWPSAFVAAVADPDAWPLTHEAEPVALVRRVTDRWVHGRTGKLPLSVSADRIAYPAMRAQRLLRRFREGGGGEVDRSGMTGAVSEVYPDPALSRFGLRPPSGRSPSYKGPAGLGPRRAILDALIDAAPWLALGPEQQGACLAFDDNLDALIAALLARAVSLGLTESPPPELREAAGREGWIHLPGPDGLEGLAPPAVSG